VNKLKKIILIGLALLIAVFFMACPEKKSNETPAPAAAAISAETPAISVGQAIAAVSSDYAARTKRPANAAKAPDFSLPDLKGGKINLADYKGKVIILDFWATWCPPCKAEVPGFIALHDKHAKDGVVMIGAAIDDVDKVKSFVKRNNVDYLVCIADQATTGNYGGIRGIPTTFVIDKEGYIVREYVGFRPEELFEQDIKDLM
jgi:cytochrome c biogenesis protein CcmG/thiol:disulfide interchange protein DsbE